MSLFGHSTDLNRQFIARPDVAKDDIIYKWPDMTIRKLTQVTVQPDETALFFKEGKLAGTLPQGRSTLDGALIPFLGDIVDWASGGNMYRAELYFVGTREFVSLPFGGPIDNIEDPETGLAVGLRVYGEYAMSVSDPATMILKLVGTRQASNELITDWAREQILKALRTSVVKKLTAEKWPVLGLAARTDAVEAALIADVQAPLAPYGIKITRLGNMTISLSPEDEQTLKGLRKDAAYTRLAGGFREYGVGAALKGIGEGAAVRRRSAWAWASADSWGASALRPRPEAVAVSGRWRRRDPLPGAARPLSNAPVVMLRTLRARNFAPLAERR